MAKNEFSFDQIKNPFLRRLSMTLFFAVYIDIYFVIVIASVFYDWFLSNRGKPTLGEVFYCVKKDLNQLQHIYLQVWHGI